MAMQWSPRPHWSDSLTPVRENRQPSFEQIESITENQKRDETVKETPVVTEHNVSEEDELGEPERPQPQYRIIVRQQPLAARACGFGERDRRAIDPPPILQLFIAYPGATSEEIDALLRSPCNVVHCALWDPVLDKEAVDMRQMKSILPRQVKRLIGTLVSSPFVGRDENDIQCCFFPFDDLSIRTVGAYRLKFSLVVLDLAKMGVGNRMKVADTITSNVILVFSPKTFPGMRPSTELTKRLKSQGCFVSIKRGNPKKNQSAKASRESEDDSSSDSPKEPGGKKKTLRFSCPYLKHDPREYADWDKWPSCALIPFETAETVEYDLLFPLEPKLASFLTSTRAHLYTTHLVFPCLRCKESFSYEKELERHILAANICEVNLSRLFTVTKGILPDLAARLKSLKKRHRGPNSQEERWKEIYRILFPAEGIPGPCYELDSPSVNTSRYTFTMLTYSADHEPVKGC
jgi:hypothetical protein